ncbi:putative nucleotidyltransferase, ribonuclease H [Tanacetum coccineum]
MVGTRDTLTNANPATGSDLTNTSALDDQTKAFIQQLINSAMAGIQSSFQESIRQVVIQQDYLTADVNRLKGGESRFDTDFEDPLSEFKNLKCDSTVQKYYEKLELLLNKVEMPEAHAISLFFGGMPQSISLPVRMFKPNSLSDTPSLNRGGYVAPRNQATPLALPAPKTNNINPIRKYLSQKEFDDKRAKGLCFHCDQKFVPGIEQEFVIPEVTNEDIPQISRNALTGLTSYRTIRVIGHYRSQRIHILIDSGSTHNFLDVYMAKKLGCKITEIDPLQVSVVDGNKITSRSMCTNFSWLLNGERFSTDVMLLPLGGCEMVLEVQWLATLGDIMWNFTSLKMQFQYEGRHVALRASVISLDVSYKPVFGVIVEQALRKLLEEFKDVFALPTTLPPQRRYDHRIPLKDGSIPVNIRPYKHPPSQKDVIESMVQELLDSKLNKLTVKDKFPIPLIEELIDELNGSRVFSKLDLRSGYHQIIMEEEDILKTAFRTYEGHYEFLVMPFGLTNAPSTFQSLMNQVFKPFLRKFTLVFFDDILVYSDNVTEHLLHLRSILIVIRENQLYAKQSKCMFGTAQVEYLGHVISKNEVATDPVKILAMKEWPTPTTLKQLRGSIRLTGYYRRFINNYATIAQPLTTLLKNNAFQWSSQATMGFEALKDSMTKAPVLKLPNFEAPFVVETDASGKGIGVVLQQEGHHVAYLSKTLAPKHQSLSAYEKELLAVIMALDRWRGNLLDRHFQLRLIILASSKENQVVDALSRTAFGGELSTMVASSIFTDLIGEVQQS